MVARRSQGIEIVGLSKRYGKMQAVKHLDLVVQPGEVFGLLGPNGAGKTTTIRTITGLTRPTSGSVRVAGFDVWRESVRAKASFGYIPDRPYLYGKLTARELLRFVAGLYKLSNAEARIEEQLGLWGLLDFGNELLETYSHGMKQKVAIVAAILPQPPVLIVDEPMVGLDPRAAKQARDLFASYAANGNTVLLTTHSLPVAEAVCHRLCVIDRGVVQGMGTLEELRGRLGTAAGGATGESLERIFFKLIESEAERKVEEELVGA